MTCEIKIIPENISTVFLSIAPHRYKSDNTINVLFNEYIYRLIIRYSSNRTRIVVICTYYDNIVTVRL